MNDLKESNKKKSHLSNGMYLKEAVILVLLLFEVKKEVFIENYCKSKFICIYEFAIITLIIFDSLKLVDFHRTPVADQMSMTNETKYFWSILFFYHSNYYEDTSNILSI